MLKHSDSFIGTKPLPLVGAFLMPGARMAADLDKPTLTHKSRCDRCGARAYVHVIVSTGKLTAAGYPEDGELYLCAHHGKKALPVLKARGTILHLIDETRFLVEHVTDDKHIN